MTKSCVSYSNADSCSLLSFFDGERSHYTAKQWDEDAQLYYFNARWYDATTARFMTEDPVKDGLLWYAYCNNNPLKFTDPTGLRLDDDLGTDLERQDKDPEPEPEDDDSDDDDDDQENSSNQEKTEEIVLEQDKEILRAVESALAELEKIDVEEDFAFIETHLGRNEYGVTQKNDWTYTKIEVDPEHNTVTVTASTNTTYIEPVSDGNGGVKELKEKVVTPKSEYDNISIDLTVISKSDTGILSVDQRQKNISGNNQGSLVFELPDNSSLVVAGANVGYLNSHGNSKENNVRTGLYK